jgi:hypothetical protein
VDAEISNVVDEPIHFEYVQDSHIRIRAADCGGSVNFQFCKNIVVDIEVDRPDNAQWRVFQHAVDFFGCEDIRARVIIRDQSVSPNGLSSYGMSGLTVANGKTCCSMTSVFAPPNPR